MNSPSRRIAATLSTILVALVATLGLAAGPAHATAYRYWGYWLGASGQWEAAQTGPAGYTVVDEDVQGWRFGITSDAPANPPANAPDFDTLCPDLVASSAPAGQARVAVVIDSGFAADAPSGQTPPASRVACVTVPAGSTGSQALAAAGTVTEQNGLVCAIDGYPKDECSAEVPDAEASAAASAAALESHAPAPIASAAASPSADAAEPASDSSGGNMAVLAIGVAALAALTLAIVMVTRRRSSGDEGE